MNSINHSVLLDSQKWKLWLLAAAVVIFGIGLLFHKEVAQIVGVDSTLVHIGALLLIFSTLSVAFISIRCPNCGLRLILHAMSHQEIGNWLNWLMALQTCPRCGHKKGRLDR